MKRTLSEMASKRSIWGIIAIGFFLMILLLNLWLKFLPTETNKSLMIFILLFFFLTLLQIKKEKRGSIY